jgi:hypothetical protein
MKTSPSLPKAWKVFYSFDQKPALKTRARFGCLTIDGDTLKLVGDDNITLTKAEVNSMEKVFVPCFVSAVQIKSKGLTVNIAAEWFHVSRSLVFAGFQRNLHKSLFNFLSQ